MALVIIRQPREESTFITACCGEKKQILYDLGNDAATSDGKSWHAAKKGAIEFRFEPSNTRKNSIQHHIGHALPVSCKNVCCIRQKERSKV